VVTTKGGGSAAARTLSRTSTARDQGTTRYSRAFMPHEQPPAIAHRRVANMTKYKKMVRRIVSISEHRKERARHRRIFLRLARCSVCDPGTPTSPSRRDVGRVLAENLSKLVRRMSARPGTWRPVRGNVVCTPRRYVDFNLLYDRGTYSDLKTAAHVEYNIVV